MPRVLAILLDGYEQLLGQRLMSAGEMPEMSRLAALSARFVLDHGSALRTGLAAEHFATGLSPDAAQRWNPIHFDPHSYSVWQEDTRLRPFAGDLQCRTVVFDVPFFDIVAAPTVRGIVRWGDHHSGTTSVSRPSGLVAELNNRFGQYPASRWLYGFAWPSVENSHSMGVELAHAVDVRAEATHWLLSERCPDWDLALVAVSEPHSVTEGLWHGIDPTHPLHNLPSAAPSEMGVRAVYQAVDRLIGKLTTAFPDALTLVFTMGGMSVNRCDVPSMLLLPELMYRHAFGSAFFRQPKEWNLSDGACPLLPPDARNWLSLMAAQFPAAAEPKSRSVGAQVMSGLHAVAAQVLPRRIKTLLRRALPNSEGRGHPERKSLEWNPTTAYQRFWPTMPAFALPSFSDGRLRLNLVGRERQGVVKPADYECVRAEVESLVRTCIDPATGESAVDEVEYSAPQDPRRLAPTQADLIIVWKGTAVCLQHPTLGQIGPVPYARTGGHTPFGMAYVRADNVRVGDQGIRSAFDVVPTIIESVGQSDRFLGGMSLLSNPQIDVHGATIGDSQDASHARTLRKIDARAGSKWM